MIAPAMPSVASTMIGGRTFGRMWRNMMEGSLAPETRAAVTYSVSLVRKHRAAHHAGVLRDTGDADRQHQIEQTRAENRDQRHCQQDAGEGEHHVGRSA